jgi:hippurate hydrolase
VVTVGSIHGGTKHNIIPDEVKLQVTVRSTREGVRQHILQAIPRIAKAAAAAARAPEPIVKVEENEFTPALLNDKELANKTAAALRTLLGADKVKERPLVMGGEDFSRYGREKVPVFMFFLGTIEPERVAEAAKDPDNKSLPSLHSDRYYPVPEPSIRTGVSAMSMAVLNLIGK